MVYLAAVLLLPPLLLFVENLSPVLPSFVAAQTEIRLVAVFVACFANPAVPYPTTVVVVYVGAAASAAAAALAASLAPVDPSSLSAVS